MVLVLSNYDCLLLQLLISKSIPEKDVLLEPLFESEPVDEYYQVIQWSSKIDWIIIFL